MDTGSMAEWASATVSALALLAACFAGWASWRTLSIERERDRLAEERGIRGQASLVSAWGAILADRPDNEKYGICLVNGSDASVFDVVVTGQRLDGEPKPDLRINVLPPGRFHVPSDPKFHWGNLVAAGAGEAGHEVPTKGKRMVTGVEFADAQGSRWRRDENGVLVALDGHGTAVAATGAAEVAPRA